MTDDLKHLKKALRDSAPQAGRRAKRAALEAAMRAFDEETQKNSRAAQGNARAGRPTGKRLKGGHFLKGLIDMTTQAINWKFAATGAASAAAIAIAAVNLPGILHKPAGETTVAMVKPGADKTAGRQAPVSPPPVMEEKVAMDSAISRNRLAMKAPAPASHNAAPRIARASRSMAYAKRKMAHPASVAASRVMPEPMPAPAYSEQGRDRFRHFSDNPVKLVSEAPVSTFSLDVDTASYAFVRRALMDGVLPPRDAVRAEEIINYFDYDYPAPADRTKPFRASVTVLPSPWRAGAKLMHIGVKGYEVNQAARPPANLVFLIDTSGSMQSPDKLPLLVNSFRLMLSSLRNDDTVSIVTYAGSAGTALPPTPVKQRAKILSVLENLTAGGSTAGGEGIRQAYALAGQAMKKGGVNRVILATDGDFNVGISDPERLKDFVAEKRKSGISLTVLGFGRGNYNDALMQALAQNGNGNALYIDTLNEARKALVQELTGNLFTIASDVKVQVEFNPAAVSEYRLVGYETRKLKREDFNNDKVDAGDIGAGHTVTAIYEFVPKGQKGLIDAPRYGKPKAGETTGKSDEYAFVKIRYKLPGESESRLITRPVTIKDEVKAFGQAPEDVRFSIAAASFAQLLRGGRYTGALTWDDVIRMGREAKGDDPFGYRAEFLNLARLAKTAQAMRQLRKQ